MSLKSEKPACPHVAILLAAKNGGRYLTDQLHSYTNQTHKNWSVYVSDDGSSDQTREIVLAFSLSSANQVVLREGPARGFSRNFLSLAEDATIAGDYFAFSDQDDIWYPTKLERALRWLQSIPASTPALYCSRTEIVDHELRNIGLSPLFRRKPSFQNALVQNVGGGNTMVFNESAKRLFEFTRDVKVISHDWWAYQAVSAIGGRVYYDPEPSVKYRQHGFNQLGSNSSFTARVHRIRQLFSGTLREWSNINIQALQLLLSCFDDANRKTFEDFIAARSSSSPVARLYYFFRSGVYRQTIPAQMGLVTAAVLGKL